MLKYIPRMLVVLLLCQAGSVATAGELDLSARIKGFNEDRAHPSRHGCQYEVTVDNRYGEPVAYLALGMHPRLTELARKGPTDVAERAQSVILRNLPPGRTSKTYLVLAMGCDTVSHLELAKVMACTVRPQVFCADKVRIDEASTLPIRRPGELADATRPAAPQAAKAVTGAPAAPPPPPPTQASSDAPDQPAGQSSASPVRTPPTQAQLAEASSEDPKGTPPGALQGNWALIGQGEPVLARVQLIHDSVTGELSGDYFLTEHACTLVGGGECELGGSAGSLLQARISADLLLLSFNPTPDEQQRFTLSLRRSGDAFAGTLRTRGPDGYRVDVMLRRSDS